MWFIKRESWIKNHSLFYLFPEPEYYKILYKFQAFDFFNYAMAFRKKLNGLPFNSILLSYKLHYLLN